MASLGLERNGNRKYILRGIYSFLYLLEFVCISDILFKKNCWKIKLIDYRLIDYLYPVLVE